MVPARESNLGPTDYELVMLAQRFEWLHIASINSRERSTISEVIDFWWPGTESNCRHADFQSAALPTELPGLCLQLMLAIPGEA